MADLSSDAAQRLAETQDAITETQYVDDDEVEASVKRSFEQLRDAFAAFDADGDGKLTEDEVVAALTRKTGQGTELSGAAARATWRRWLAECDFNDDGELSFEEVAQRITGGVPAHPDDVEDSGGRPSRILHAAEDALAAPPDDDDDDDDDDLDAALSAAEFRRDQAKEEWDAIVEEGSDAAAAAAEAEAAYVALCKEVERLKWEQLQELSAARTHGQPATSTAYSTFHTPHSYCRS